MESHASGGGLKDAIVALPTGGVAVPGGMCARSLPLALGAQGAISEGCELKFGFASAGVRLIAGLPYRRGTHPIDVPSRQKVRENFRTRPFLDLYCAEDAAIALCMLFLSPSGLAPPTGLLVA